MDSPRSSPSHKLSRRLRTFIGHRTALRTGFKMVALLALASVPSVSRAVVYSFEGTGTTDTPATGNFSGTGFAPTLDSGTATPISTTADTLTFAGGTAYIATDDFTAQIVANALSFSNTAAITLARGGTGTSNSISLGGTTPAINLTNTAPVTDALDLALAANTSITGTGALTISGAVSGAFVLTKTGAGTTTLSGTNTYSSTTLSGGTLVAASTAAVGTGKLTFGGSTAVFDLATDGGDNAIAVSVGTGAVGTIASDVVTGTVGINHTLGAFTLSNTTINFIKGANVLSGSPTITIGTINLSSGTAGTTSTLNPTSASLIVSGAISASTAAKNLVLDGTAQGNRITAGVQASSGITLIKSNTSTWELDATNTYAGGTTINGGTLTLGPTGTAGAATGSLTINSTGTGVGGASILNLATGLNNTVGNLNGTVSQTGVTSGTNSVTINTQTGRAFIVNQTTAGTFGGVIAGAGSFTASGTAALTLTGVNTYTGGTTIGNGGATATNTSVLLITNSSALGTGAVLINGAGAALAGLQLSGGITTATGNTLAVNGARNISTGGPILENVSGNNTFQGAININGAGGNGANIQSDAGTLTVSGNLTSYNGAQNFVFQGAGNTVFSGVLNAAGPLQMRGTGTLTLTGANTSTGTTTINAGTLAASATTGKALGGTTGIAINAGTLALGTANQVNTTAPISMGVAATSTGILSVAAGANQGTANSSTGGTVAPATVGTGTITTGGTPGTGTNAVGLGALTLNNTATLAFTGTPATLVFSGFTPNSNVLTISGFVSTTTATAGSSGIDGTDDRLVFNGDQAANLANFNFGQGAGVGVSEVALGGGFFEVYGAVPEPSTWVGGLLSLGVVGFAQRRRMGAWLRTARQS